MIISFDLDDTLFVSPDKFKVEKKLRFPWSQIYKERLRLGTVSLIQKLQRLDIKIWIYTTSFRSEHYIRSLFRHYGIRLDFIINGTRHAREVQGGQLEPMPSKYPGKYRIDLHIDDDRSVLENGRQYGFSVYLVGAQDDNWDKKLLEHIQKIQTHQSK